MARIDRIIVFIEGFKKTYNCHPIQTEIADGLGITRQAVRNYFLKNKETLKKIPEYRRYFS